MSNANDVPWKRLAIEAPAIVLSILLAFAIDAWWEERQAAKAIAEDLAIVEYELNENVRLVTLAIEIMQQSVAASGRLIEGLDNSEAAEKVSVAATDVFWGIFNNPTLDPSLGGTDAWIAAGQLGVIESFDLRQRLAGVRGKFEDTIEEQRVAREVGIALVYPAIQTGIEGMSAVRALYAAGHHSRQATAVLPVPDAGDVDLVNSRELRFALEVRTLWYEASIVESQDLLEELKEIHSLVQKEVAR